MADLRRRPRGWHLDPGDPTRVRHWDGERWERLRSRPTWSLSTDELVVDTEGHYGAAGKWAGPVVEGPARPATERAATGALGAGGETTGPGIRPAARPAAVSAGSPHRQGRPPAGGPPPPAISPWGASRRPLVVFAVMVVVAVIAMVGTVGWPGPQVDTVAPTSSAFVTQASQVCASVFGPHRTAPPVAPRDLTTSAAQVDQLAGRLATLAPTTDAGPEIVPWLSTWHRFAADERQEAAALTAGRSPADSRVNPAATVTGRSAAASTAGPVELMSHPQGPSAVAVAKEVRADADQADKFAVANGLSSCTLIPRGPTAVQSIPS